MIETNKDNKNIYKKIIIVLNMLRKKAKPGAYIQVSRYPRETGNNFSKGIVIEEDPQTVYNRILTLYEELSENDSVTIKFHKNGRDEKIN